MNINGNLPQKRSSVISLNRDIALILEILLIIMGGALAAYMHFKLKIPLNIPGHHGLEFMAIFMLIRLESSLKYAATVATLGVGLFFLIPGMGAGTPLHSLGYMLPGIILDLLYRFMGGRAHIVIIAAMVAGLSYMSIPLSRLFIQLSSGYHFMAFIKFGIMYTMLSFFFFGFLGGTLGYGLSSIKSKLKQAK